MDFIEWNEYYESWYPGTPEDLRRNLEEIHQAFPDKRLLFLSMAGVHARRTGLKATAAGFEFFAITLAYAAKRSSSAA